MRRALGIGLVLAVCVGGLVGGLVGVRAWQLRARARQTAVASAVFKVEAVKVPPLPQDAAAIARRRQDMLAWNRRTLGEAYDRVGKKDPRWDDLAHTALDLAARRFSLQVEPLVTDEELYQAAKAAVEAGCDDPMVGYLYARSPTRAEDSDPEVVLRHARTAARGLAASEYPPFRRAVALRLSGERALYNRRPNVADQNQAEEDFDAALALLAESVARDEHNPFWEDNWGYTLLSLTGGYRALGVPAENAYERVDAGLARVPGAKLLRLNYRGNFYVSYGWEGRTNARAQYVPQGGFELLEKRLAIARQAFLDAWEFQPGSGRTANGMVTIETGVGGDRDAMELWFERGIKANGDDVGICSAKLNWLDPKWHGSPEEMLAFGRACRDSKNWRAGITLLLADAHWRIGCMLGSESSYYLAQPEVWDEIRAVYDDYLTHCPNNDSVRSQYATVCHYARHYREAEVQYVLLGDRLTGWVDGPRVTFEELKEARERNIKILLGQAGGIARPGWHFVGGRNQDGEWLVNVPLHSPHVRKPGILGAPMTDTFSCVTGGITYRVRVVPLPPEALKKGRARLLDEARAGVAEERGTTPRDRRATLLAARPAEEYSLDITGLKPMRLRVKATVIDHWYYEFSVIASGEDAIGPDANEFFDSFAFRSDPKPDPEPGAEVVPGTP